MPAHFQVHRDDLSKTRIVDSPDTKLESGEVRLAIERFAITANNITYGVAGDMIGYWQFFSAEDGWGRIPVWGIARVIESEHPGVQPGARFYGYFPMSEELIVKPEKVNDRGFRDASPHRAELPPVYNQYATVTPELGFAPEFDRHAMVYRPLFTTSFVLDDYLVDHDFFGADAIIIGSASSKTGFGLAFMLKRRGGKKVVGLTSPGNVAFVRSLGLYDEVLTYDDVESLAREPSAYVDMAGNREVLARVHRHLDNDLRLSCGVGITHWEARDGEDPATLPGPKPTMFFAPSQILKRNEEMGPEQYQAAISEATQAFFAVVDEWVTIEEQGFDKVEDVYRTVLNGPPADHAFVVSV